MTGRRIAHELAVAVLVVLVGALLGALFISGASWVTYKLLPLFQRLAIVALCLSLLVSLPLAVARRTRRLSSRAIFVASYIFGATLWIDSFQVAASIWGAGGLIIGFVIVAIGLIPVSTGWRKRFGPWRGGLMELAAVLGVGVVPVAMLAAMLNGMWQVVIELTLLLVATIGCRVLALHLSAGAQGAVGDTAVARRAPGPTGGLMNDDDETASDLLRMMRTAGTPEGSRERCRLSYDKHLRLALKGAGVKGDPPHHTALYGALASWYKVRGVDVPEVSIWGELAPFLLITPEGTAREALAEYSLYLEEREGWWGQVSVGTRATWLRELINGALRTAPSPNSMAVAGLMNQVAWCDLLDLDVREPLDREVGRVREILERESHK
jgi:hypothetical protein